ncbi:MAG: 50S ribosomal protein L10 [Candidatus Woesearchaeota archaeon]
MKMYKAHVSEGKIKEVESIRELFDKYRVVAIIDMENLPALQLQKMKAQLKDKIVIKISKKRLMKLAIDKVNKKDIAKLKEDLRGMVALLFTNEDPFKLYKLLKKSKSNASAKPGQIAPKDLIAPAGPTNFAPGPIIGELGQAGLKTEIKEGKVAIKEDKLLVKQGEVINAKAADILAKLGIEPMEIGLNLVLTYENGEVLRKDILDVDEEECTNRILECFRNSLNLAVHISYISKDTVEMLIRKVYTESNAINGKLDLKNIKIEKEEVKEAEIETKEEVVEMKEKIKDEDVEVAQKVLKQLQDKKIEQQKMFQTSQRTIDKDFTVKEKELDKIITKLKDKKARGEI